MVVQQEERTLAGKVVLVTGSARRIGATVVRKLHTAGATVVIHYRSSTEDALRLCDELNQQRADSCFLIEGDLQQVSELPAMIAEVLKQAGRLDILINNASVFYPTALEEVTEQDWDILTGTNMKVPLFMAQAAMAELKRNQGSIINMVDIHAYRPLEGHIVYNAAKAGLLMLTQSLAKELGPYVRVNGIAPGAILWPEQALTAAQQDVMLAKTALKRVGDPEDIARAILFLVRDADYITGQILPVDGGRLLNQ